MFGFFIAAVVYDAQRRRTSQKTNTASGSSAAEAVRPRWEAGYGYGSEVVGRAIPKGLVTDQGSIATTSGSVYPQSYGNGLGSAIAWGPPSTMVTVTTPGSNLRPAGNIDSNDISPSSPLFVNRKGWSMKCHAEDDRKIGDPQL